MRMITIHGSKTLHGAEGLAVRLAASAVMMSRNTQRLSARAARIETLPVHRRSIERAALAVEEQFVKAMWVLQRSTGETRPIGFNGSNGLSYMAEHVDLIGQAVANGGWNLPAPRPALPSSREIDAAAEAQTWLTYLDPQEARVLTVGAMSKFGDAGRKINWTRVRGRLPELASYTTRTLQMIYTRALRNIVAELTHRKASGA